MQTVQFILSIAIFLGSLYLLSFCIRKGRSAWRLWSDKHKPFNPMLLLLLSIAVYYGTGYALGIIAIFANILVWGRWNIFGYIMPFLPFIAGFLIGRMIGKHQKNKTGIALSIVIPLVPALGEGMFFHAAYLTVIMHPVPHYEIAFPTILFFPVLMAISYFGYRIGSKGTTA